MSSAGSSAARRRRGVNMRRRLLAAATSQAIDAVSARAGDADHVLERAAGARGSAQRLGSDCGSTNATSAPLLQAGTRAPRGRTGTTAAPRSRPSGKIAMCAIDRLGPLRQDERDAVAARDARGRRARSTAGSPLLQVPERVRRRARPTRPPNTARSACGRRPSAAAGLRDVEVRGDVPAKAVVELGVAVHHGLDLSLHDTRRLALAPRSLSVRRATARSSTCTR